MYKRVTAVLLILFILLTVPPGLGTAGSEVNPQKEVLGYYTNAEAVDYDGKVFKLNSSYDTVINNSKNISMAVPFWFRLHSKGNGGIEFQTYGLNSTNADTQSKEIVKSLKSKNIKVLALIHNMLYKDGTSGKDLAHSIMASTNNMNRFINNVEAIMKNYGFDGVNIDIEGVYASDRDNYTNLIKNLKEKLGSKGYLVTVSIPAKTYDSIKNSYTYPFNYKGIGKYADRVAIMTYDEHGAWTGSGAGPIASVPWQEAVVKYALKLIPKEKILLGIPTYGFDWTEGKSWPKYSSYQMSMDTAQKYGKSISWDAQSKVPYFKYKDSNGSRQVWFENASSFNEKLSLVYKYDLKGIAIWRLGMEDPKMWNVISSRVNVSKSIAHEIFDSKWLYTQRDNILMKLSRSAELSDYKIQITNENGAAVSSGIEPAAEGSSTLYSLFDLDDGFYTAVVTANRNGEESELDRKTFGINCFADIKNHWARSTIINLYKEGYIKGAGEDMFKPDENLTRAEFMALISRVLDITDPQTGFETKFSDIRNRNHWAYNYITGLEENGYIQGEQNSSGKICIYPDRSITRAEMSSLLSRILEKQGRTGEDTTAEIKFTDVKGHWAENAVIMLEKLGLIAGKSTDKFEPDSKTTRAEAAVIIERYLDLAAKK